MESGYEPSWAYCNYYVARALEEMAHILETHDVGGTRPYLLRRAAHAIRRSEKEVADLLQKGGIAALARLPHIGARLAPLVAELATRGKGRALARLRNEMRAKEAWRSQAARVAMLKAWRQRRAEFRSN